MNQRELQKQKRRQEILEVGLDLFVKYGYGSIKISDIASKANMSTGLMFHYFKSKEELYDTLVKIGMEGTQGVMSFDTNDSLSFFEQAASGILNSMVDSPFYAKIFVLMSQDQRTRDKIERVSVIEQCVPLIEKGQKEGVFKEGNSLLLSFTFWASLQGVAESLLLYDDIGIPDSNWLLDILKK